MAKRKGKKVVEKKAEFRLYDTSVIQAESLRLFMASLGYLPARPNGGWITENPALIANRNISTRTAIRLHNLPENEWVSVTQGWFRPSGINIDLAVTRATLRVVFANKLVHQVKFSPAKNTTNGLSMPVDPLAHLVKPADAQFLIDWNIIQPVSE